MFAEEYFSDLLIDFFRRTQANEKIHFGILRTKNIKSLIHWVEYFYRILGDPTIVETNEVIFIKQFDTSLYRAETRKKLINQSDTKAKESSLGPLESENKRKEWESKFINYLSTLIGVNGVPLSYMVRGKVNPDANGDFPIFIDKTIACGTLKGNY